MQLLAVEAAARRQLLAVEAASMQLLAVEAAFFSSCFIFLSFLQLRIKAAFIIGYLGLEAAVNFQLLVDDLNFLQLLGIEAAHLQLPLRHVRAPTLQLYI